MTEKVKVTQEQAETIENLKRNGFTDESIIESHAKCPNGWMLSENTTLNRMSLLKLVDALRIGYEVEPQFKVGDWIVKLNGECFMRGEKVMKVTEVKDNCIYFGVGRYLTCRYIRLATPEEIKTEKERRLWKSIGREIGEFRIGDMIEMERQLGFKIYLDRQIEVAKHSHQDGKVTGFFPAESFISFEEVKS